MRRSGRRKCWSRRRSRSPEPEACPWWTEFSRQSNQRVGRGRSGSLNQLWPGRGIAFPARPRLASGDWRHGAGSLENSDGLLTWIILGAILMVWPIFMCCEVSNRMWSLAAFLVQPAVSTPTLIERGEWVYTTRLPSIASASTALLANSN